MGNFGYLIDVAKALVFAIGIRVFVAFLFCLIVFIVLGKTTNLSLAARKLIFSCLMALTALVAIKYGLESGEETRKRLTAEMFEKSEQQAKEKKEKREAEKRARELNKK